MENYKIIFDTIDWESPLPGVRFKKYRSENKQIRLVEYTKTFQEPDWCLKGHIGYVIAGEFNIDFSGKIVSFKPGNSIFIPPGEAHKHKVNIISDKVLVFLAEDIQPS